MDLQGHGPDRAHIGRDFVTLTSVAPSGCPDQQPLFISEVNGQAIDLGLHHVGGASSVQLLEHTRLKGTQFVRIVRVVNAQHGYSVPDRGKSVHRPF